MPTLVLENVPASLYDRILRPAKARQRTPAEIVIEALEIALRTTTPTFFDAPFEILWPEGETVVPIHIAKYVPEPHDLPDDE